MTHATETPTSETGRTPDAYRRDLHRTRLVIGQLRDPALATREPFLSTLEGIPVRTNKRGKPPPGPPCRPDLATCPGCLHRMGKTQTSMGWKLDWPAMKRGCRSPLGTARMPGL